jgi:hypothetical protein
MGRFHEVQRLRSPPIFICAGLLAALAWAAVIDRLLYGHAHGVDPAPTGVVVTAWVVLGLVVPVLVSRIALVVDVDEERLAVGFNPLRPRTFGADAIGSCETSVTPPSEGILRWGVRFEVGGHPAFILEPGRCVEVRCTDGRRITIGTRDPDGLTRALLALRGAPPIAAGSAK